LGKDRSPRRRQRRLAPHCAYHSLDVAAGGSVLINGTTVTVKMVHVRLCHSRMLFVRAHQM
jgi:hypothetical protein